MKSIARSWVYSHSNPRLCCLPKSTTITKQLHHRAYATKPYEQDGRPFRMAVIGSGPAGFYTAYRVMSKIDNAVVDMYESLPVPFGLVRFGVSPDHPEVKVSYQPLSFSPHIPNTNSELPGEIRRRSLLPTLQLHRQHRHRFPARRIATLHTFTKLRRHSLLLRSFQG